MLRSIRLPRSANGRNFRKFKFVHPVVTKLIPKISAYCSEEQYYSSFHGKQLSSILFHTANGIDYNYYSPKVKELNHLQIAVPNEKSNFIITFKLTDKKEESDILNHISCVMRNAPLSETLRVYSDYMNEYGMRAEYEMPSVNWDNLMDTDLSQLIPTLIPYNTVENKYFWKKLTKILFYAKNYDNYKDNEHFNKFTCDFHFPNDNIPYYILNLMRNSDIIEKFNVYYLYMNICETMLRHELTFPKSSIKILEELQTFNSTNLRKLIPELYKYEYVIHHKTLSDILFYASNCYSRKDDKIFQVFTAGLQHTNRDILYHIDTIMTDATDNERKKVFHQYITLYDALVTINKQSCILSDIMKANE